MTSALPEDQRLHNLSPKAYEHPADRAATAAMQSIPGLQPLIGKLIELGYERALRQRLLGQSVRIGEEQLPDIWADWNAVCARLDIPRPDLYLAQNPFTNAMTIGAEKPMVLINSSTLNLCDQAEIRTILGHEAGHVLSRHMLYLTAMQILIALTEAIRLPFIGGLPLKAVLLVLLEWYRAAELSADRAATLVNRDPLVTCRVMMVLAAGKSSSELNLDAFIAQAHEYEDWKSGWDRVSRALANSGATHGPPVRRVKEIMTWVRSGAYDRVANGEFPTRNETPDARKEASDAYNHYRQRFTKIFTDFNTDSIGDRMGDVGDKVGEVGDKAADTADKLREWFRSRRGT